MKRATMILGTALLIAAAPAAAQEDNASKEKEKPAAAADAQSKPAPDKTAEPAAPKAAEKMAKSDAVLTLARLAVCEDVEDRVPVGEAESFEGVRHLYCFSRVEGASTPTRVFHRWYVGDKMVNEIPINVKGPRWRCWSQKSIQPSWSGSCKVEVVTEGGDVLGTKNFTLAAASGAGMKDEASKKASEAKAAGQAKAKEAKAEADEHAEEQAGDQEDHTGHDHD